VQATANDTLLIRLLCNLVTLPARIGRYAEAVDIATALRHASHTAIYRAELQPAWGFWLVGNLTTLAAFSCAAVGVWRTRTASRDRNTPRWLAAAAVALSAFVASGIATDLFEHVFITDPDSSAVSRTMTAVICAATLPFTIVATMGIRPTLFCAIGWLISGWGTILIHVWYLSDEYTHPLTLLWTLLVISTIAAIVASVLLRPSHTAWSTPTARCGCAGQR
jgi:hypothetical protein